MESVGINKITKYIPIISTLKNYKKSYVKKDLIAAITVAVVAIPQSMAYAIIAGIDPVYGLYTAILSTIIGSVFGSSNHMIAGPTNAIALLIASNMKNFLGRENVYEMIFLMTFMVGALQILFGIFKLGKALNYVSHAIVVGFTAAAGLLIAMGQLNQLLGVTIENSAQMPVLNKFTYIITHIRNTNLLALGLGLFTIAVILICKRINKNLPGSLISIILSIIVALIFSLEKSDIKLTGNIPSALPAFKLFSFNLENAKELFRGALAIAIIGLIEAISIAKSIAASSHQKIDANQEFIGQGLSNSISSFFQCFAGSGSFTRSAVNYFSGAATRISGILSGIFVAVVLVFFGSFAKYIPMPSLAGVIMVIAYNMVNKEEIKKVINVGKSDAIVMCVTFIATIFMPDLDWAIYTGIIVSIMLYLKDTNKVRIRILIPSEEKKGRFREKEIDTVNNKVNVLIIQMEGNLYFGSAEDLSNKLDTLIDKADIFILRMKRVGTVDITSLGTIKVFIEEVKKSKGIVLVCGVSASLNEALKNSGLTDDIGNENIFLYDDEIFSSSYKALKKAKEIIDYKQIQQAQ